MNLADIIKSKAHATAYFFKGDWGFSQSVEELSKYVIFEGSEAYIKAEKGMFAEVQPKISTTLVKYEVNISEDEGVGSIYIDYVNRRKPSMFHTTRKYPHSFNKYFDPNTQQDLSYNQANEIKKRNKEIKNELNNIDTLLNDQNDKFDTDLAKAKLDKLKKYQDKMSNNNQSRYKDLEKQQLKKEAEVTEIFKNLKEQSDALKENEQERQNQEAERKAAETARQAKETVRQTQELERKAAETARQTQELERKAGEEARKATEAARQAEETARQTQESERKVGEEARKAGEAARQAEETARQTQEVERKAGEEVRKTAEAARQAEETARQTQELERKAVEEARKATEAARQAEETARQTQESERKVGEEARKAGEAARQAEETARQTQEVERKAGEEVRKTAEAARQAEETARQTQESERKAGEEVRKTAEAARQAEETARQTQESERKAGEEARKATEAARQAEETARQTQESERKAGEEARKAAETARQAEETARLKLNQQFEQTLELIKSESHYNVVTIEGDIKVLSQRKELIYSKLEQTLELIKSESHKTILKVKESDYNQSFTETKKKEYRDKIQKNHQDYIRLENNDNESALKYLKKALECAVHLAPKLVTGKYDFTTDCLNIKKMLRQYSELDTKIKQSDLNFKIKKHSEEIALQNQTLELQVSEIYQDHQIAKKKQLFQSGFQSFTKSWELEEDGKSEDALELIKEAKKNFADAKQIPVKITEDCEKYFDFCQFKIDGDQYFTTGYNMVQKAKRLLSGIETHANAREEITTIQTKALDLLQSAKKCFQNGLELGESKFKWCIDDVNEFITEEVSELESETVFQSSDSDQPQLCYPEQPVFNNDNNQVGLTGEDYVLVPQEYYTHS